MVVKRGSDDERRCRRLTDPGQVRCPDCQGHISLLGEIERSDSFDHRPRVSDDFSNVPPDLAVEVLSPSDRPRFVLDKVGEYLQAGVRLVWVIDPKRRRAAVYRSTTDVREILEDGVLDGEDVVPGFAVALAEILASS